jgi:hypothetical protein
MPIQFRSRCAREPQLRDHYVYSVNALIEEGHDDLVREVVTEARRELATPAARRKCRTPSRDCKY